mmetsp:Transcript_17935/g.35776  ORF Transcript_17935/g.35776 Transcript_17935/m.35776 type:complete len:220 (-) Transcript_17935:624-1283(-)
MCCLAWDTGADLHFGPVPRLNLDQKRIPDFSCLRFTFIFLVSVDHLTGFEAYLRCTSLLLLFLDHRTGLEATLHFSRSATDLGVNPDLLCGLAYYFGGKTLLGAGPHFGPMLRPNLDQLCIPDFSCLSYTCLLLVSLGHHHRVSERPLKARRVGVHIALHSEGANRNLQVAVLKVYVSEGHPTRRGIFHEVGRLVFDLEGRRRTFGEREGGKGLEGCEP